MEKAMDEKIIMNYEVVELLHKSSSWGNIVFKVKPHPTIVVRFPVFSAVKSRKPV